MFLLVNTEYVLEILSHFGNANVNRIQGDSSSCQTLAFADLIFGDPACSQGALPVLPHLQQPKQNWAESGSNEIVVNKS